MGNQSSINFSHSKWVQCECSSSNSKKLYQNNQGLIGQYHNLSQSQLLSLQQQLQIYKQRYLSKLPLAKVYQVSINSQKSSFCSSTQNLKILTEHIPNRLNTIKSFSLTQQQAIYVLHEMILGFSFLFQKFGYFQININMVGFDIKGKLKCWINQKFQTNRIDHMNITLNQDNFDRNSFTIDRNSSRIDPRLKQNLQKSMVADIWENVKKKSNIQSRQLYQKLSNLQNVNFQQASKIINYLKSKSPIRIPECLYFQNNLSNVINKYQQYSYGDSFEEQNQRTKPVQLMQLGFFQNGRFIINVLNSQPTFKDFDMYRNHINNLNKNNICQKLNSTFSKVQEKNKQRFNNPQDYKKQESLKIVAQQKLFQASASSIPKYPSIKTIQQSEGTKQSQKQIQSTKRLSNPPIQNIKRTISYIIPTSTSSRLIFNDRSNNRVQSPYDRVVYNSPYTYNQCRSPNFKNPIQQNYGIPIQQNYGIPRQQNYRILRKQNYGSPRQQDYESPIKQDYRSPIKQDYRSPRQQDFENLYNNRKHQQGSVRNLPDLNKMKVGMIKNIERPNRPPSLSRYPTLQKSLSNRYMPPPHMNMKGITQHKQSILGYLDQPQTPQFDIKFRN